ncbi:PhoH family protein [Vibrio phage VCPH]|nr:PhoH family protein [Vibrio phage VCPH]
MTKKLFILDTNVLLSDPYAMLKFDEHDVAIPMTVLMELDAQKSSSRDIARDARVVIRQLSQIIGGANPLKDGVELPTGGTFSVINHTYNPNIFTVDNVATPDDVIISNAFAEQGNRDATLVTNDVCMRLKALGAGVEHVQEYRNDVVVQNLDSLPKGYFNLPEGWMNTLDKEQAIAKSCGKTLIKEEVIAELVGDEPLGINDWLINEADGIFAQFEGRYEDQEKHPGFLEFTFTNPAQVLGRKAAGISPKDIEQAIALDALLDPNIDIVVINGAAGSGKTLLAMAAATEMIKGRKGYRHHEVIVSRSMDSQFSEIGFLPGTETEKTKPWLSGIIDNMEVICRTTKNAKFHPTKSIASDGEVEPGDDAFIYTKALNFMRGRSISQKIFVIDEIQNLTATQLKTVLSRAGEDCKVIIMGSCAQIDNPVVSPRTSALTYATEKFHGVDFAKVITLNHVHRSRLAEFVEENF